MYGLVNQAVQDFVTHSYGEPTWLRVRKQAGMQDADFILLEQYPDALTFGLVGATCEATGCEAEKLVEAIGEYWVAFTAQRGYGALLDQLGETFPEALANLDAMHVRVALMMPSLQPPSFRVSDVMERSLMLTYISKRQGLTAMVIGLVKGLARRPKYKLDATVTLFTAREEGGDTDVFKVTW